MKIIDLLNKIAKGEEVPKKIKSCNHTFELIKYPCCGVEVTNYKDEDGDYLFGVEYELILLLNDEVEIIEEEKEIEKLEVCMEYEYEEVNDNLEKDMKTIVFKINEIIDKLNDMRDKE